METSSIRTRIALSDAMRALKVAVGNAEHVANWLDRGEWLDPADIAETVAKSAELLSDVLGSVGKANLRFVDEGDNGASERETDKALRRHSGNLKKFSEELKNEQFASSKE